MEIRTDQIAALLQQQELQAKKSTSGKGEGFDAALEQQMALGGTETSGKATMPAPGVQASVINQMLLSGVENISAADSVTLATGKAYDQASGALDMWESYVNVLGSPGNQGTLREADALLQGLESQVTVLKQQSEPLLGQNSNLASLVNELEVMTATERFKFNRGDYLA